MLKELIKMANELDQRGHRKEADALDEIIKLAGKRVVEKIGDVKIYKDSDWGEYIVVPGGSTPTCDSAYHTDDMEDAIDTARAMDKKQLNKEAGGLSRHQMLEDEKQGDEELKIASLMLIEARRRSGREDISKEMLEEFLLDIRGDVKRLMKELTNSMTEFNMEPFDQEEDEPTEIAEANLGDLFV